MANCCGAAGCAGLEGRGDAQGNAHDQGASVRPSHFCTGKRQPSGRRTCRIALETRRDAKAYRVHWAIVRNRFTVPQDKRRRVCRCAESPGDCALNPGRWTGRVASVTGWQTWPWSKLARSDAVPLMKFIPIRQPIGRDRNRRRKQRSRCRPARRALCNGRGGLRSMAKSICPICP